MAEFPALPLFTDAFIADTTHLNALQTGAYLMLLIVAWRSKTGRLPNDDKLLARYSRMDTRQWNQNKEVILEFWKTDENGYLFQERLLDEREFVAQQRQRSVAAGKASALKRNNRGSTTAATNTPTKPQRNVNPPPHPTLLDNLNYYPNKITKIVGAPSEPKVAPQKKGSRLPKDWVLSEEIGLWAMTQGFSKNEVLREEEKFKNYWQSKAGKDGLKLDWDATFRSWIFNAQEYRK